MATKRQARAIFHVIVVDMMIKDASGAPELDDQGNEKEPDVIAEMTLCAASPEHAQKAVIETMGRTPNPQKPEEMLLVKGRWYMPLPILIAPLPTIGGSVVLPDAAARAKILGPGGQFPIPTGGHPLR